MIVVQNEKGEILILADYKLQAIDNKKIKFIERVVAPKFLRSKRTDNLDELVECHVKKLDCMLRNVEIEKNVIAYLKGIRDKYVKRRG